VDKTAPVGNSVTMTVAVAVTITVTVTITVAGTTRRVSVNNGGSTTVAAQVVRAVASGDAVAHSVSHNVVITFVTAFEHDELSSRTQTDGDVTRKFSACLVCPNQSRNTAFNILPSTWDKSAPDKDIVVERNKFHQRYNTGKVKMKLEDAIRESDYGRVGYVGVDGGVCLASRVRASSRSNDRSGA